MPQFDPKEKWSERMYNQLSSATRVFQVPLDPSSETISEQTAIDKAGTFFGIGIGVSHPADPMMRVPLDGITADTAKGANFYTVRVQYKWGISGTVKDPLNRKPTYKWITGSTSEQYDRDRNKFPITNSVGDIPSNKPTKFVGLLGMYIKRWEPDFNVDRYKKYNNSINTDTIKIGKYTFEPGQLFFSAMEQLQERTLDVTPIEIGYRIDYREGEFKIDGGLWDGWLERFVDKGRRAWFADPNNNGKNNLQNLYTADEGKMVRVSEDVNLDGGGIPIELNGSAYRSSTNAKAVTVGKALSAGAIVVDATDGTATYLIYKDKYKILPFAALNLFY